MPNWSRSIKFSEIFDSKLYCSAGEVCMSIQKPFPICSPKRILNFQTNKISDVLCTRMCVAGDDCKSSIDDDDGGERIIDDSSKPLLLCVFIRGLATYNRTFIIFYVLFCVPLNQRSNIVAMQTENPENPMANTHKRGMCENRYSNLCLFRVCAVCVWSFFRVD